MKKQSIFIGIITLATLISGLVNIFSVIGPSLPERTRILQNIVSFEFQHFARFLTLLVGFALVVASINIYKRKKRAFWFVFGLAGLSIAFHLLKGLDYEETIPELILIGLLLGARKQFTVKSSIPNLKRGLLRFSVALVTVFVYGVVGFWFIDRYDFGVQLSTTDVAFGSNLDEGRLTPSLRDTLSDYGIELSQAATVKILRKGKRWEVADGEHRYTIRSERGTLNFHEFGVNFTLGVAIREMGRFFIFQGDPNLFPRTRHARWFANSLYLMSSVAIVYALIALFRPVVYRFRVHSGERERAEAIVKKYGRSPLDSFKYGADKSFFFSRSGHGVVSYGVANNFAIGLADPSAPEAEMESLIREFVTFCDENDWNVGFHETLPDFLPIYEKLGFQQLKIGDEAIVDLPAFTLTGSDKKEFRQVLNRSERDGFHTITFAPPIPDDVLAELKVVSDEWLQIPGRRERKFKLGTFEPNYIRSCPIAAVVDKAGEILAFVNRIPSGCPGEVTFDLMRRRTEAPPGIMDYLFVRLILDAKEKGFTRMSLGMAPMSGFQEGEAASPEEKAVHFLFQHLNFLFSFSGLRQFKAKYATIWEPRYIIYRNVLELPGFAIAIRNLCEIDPGLPKLPIKELTSELMDRIREELAEIERIEEARARGEEVKSEE